MGFRTCEGFSIKCLTLISSEIGWLHFTDPDLRSITVVPLSDKSTRGRFADGWSFSPSLWFRIIGS